MRCLAYIFLLACLPAIAVAQSAEIRGKVRGSDEPVAFAVAMLQGTGYGAKTDENGVFVIKNIPEGKYNLAVSYLGFEKYTKTINLKAGQRLELDIQLQPSEDAIGEVVISGTMKEVSKLESPVPVEVYTPKLFAKNPTPNLFDALQMVNGVRPQLNCNICNTGDIHINGLEGPYTMILIDGMPIVSGLSTVYGLSGIPNSLVERIEIVKGPASSLYGSEAVGGLINVITKKPASAPKLTADVFGTSWGEANVDIGYKFKAGRKADALAGVNIFHYQLPVDNNNDNFTDITLQSRVSLFNKWSFQRKDNRLFSLAGRYNYEDRWGGDMRWTKKFRGGDSIYGESIYTSRWELIGIYQLPLKEKMNLWLSYNDHDQNSVYGNTIYLARQKIAFSQLTWDKNLNRHSLLGGLAFRYTYYDDNTTATAETRDSNAVKNMPDNIYLPGIFLQDEITLTDKHKVLLGIRYDYNSRHGNIYTPRAAYKCILNSQNILRLNAGTGFRVVNLFTEDHAALTGARYVEVKSELKPERSYNANFNYVKKIYTQKRNVLSFDATAWYTYFTNRIIADYDTDPNRIIYDNLQGYAISRGISLNTDFAYNNGLKIIAGATLMDVSAIEQDSTDNYVKQQQMLTEKWTGTWAVSYKWKKTGITFDYTGNIYGPMRLPLLGKLDPRREYSPVWTIQNIQLTKEFRKGFEVYGGLKNLLNWTPSRNNPFIIARTNDPFDKEVQYDATGQVRSTPGNPYALTFDPTYVYAPNQGVRVFLGLRWTIR